MVEIIEILHEHQSKFQTSQKELMYQKNLHSSKKKNFVDRNIVYKKKMCIAREKSENHVLRQSKYLGFDMKF